MKNILITGDSSGLGNTLCHYLSEKQHKIIGVARREPKNLLWEHYSIDLEEEYIEKIRPLLCDIDTLIHNAAIPSKNLCVVEPMSTYEKVFRINTLSPIHITKEWISSRLLQKKSGQVIFVSSICTKKHFKGLAAYAASKSAINSFAKTVAIEFGKKKIYSNIILPGYMKTEMTSSMDLKKIEKIKQRTPTKELCEPKKVCIAIENLINNPGIMNGAEIVIDGGFII